MVWGDSLWLWAVARDSHSGVLSVTNIPRSGDGMSALKRDFGHVAGYLLHPLLKEGLNLPGSPPPPS